MAAALQFWIRGDLAAEQRRSLTKIGARAIPMSATRPTPEGLGGAAWTMIEAPPGEPEAERNRLAALIGAEPETITGPYAPH
jgi:hypothetical protein